MYKLSTFPPDFGNEPSSKVAFLMGSPFPFPKPVSRPAPAVDSPFGRHPCSDSLILGVARVVAGGLLSFVFPRF